MKVCLELTDTTLTCRSVAETSLLLIFLALADGFTSHWTGQPGLPWTQEEMLTVKALIVQIFLQNNVVYNEYMRLHPEKEKPNWQVFLPNAAKFLRLGFHDCLTTDNISGPGNNRTS